MTPHLQEFIHRFEVGQGARWMRAAVALLALLVIAALYQAFEFQNLSRPESMDAAQVARQVARGEGFTTQCIRPLSVRQLERRALDREAVLEDAGRLRDLHPDLANPPLYPLLLGGVFRVIDPEFRIDDLHLSNDYKPDRWVVCFTFGLLILVVLATYGLAARLFDAAVGGLAATALAGSALLWREAAAGGGLMLATLVVTLLAWCLVAFDEAARDEERSNGRGQWARAALAGGLTALAGLTYYGLLLLVLPLAVVLFPGAAVGRRWSSFFVAVIAFLLVIAPWLGRNHQLSGRLFGTATAGLVANTSAFSGDAYERSLEAEMADFWTEATTDKLISRLEPVLTQDLPGMTGSWLSAFFLVGLLFRFASPTREVLRLFAIMAVLSLVPLQALLGPGAVVGSEWSGTSYFLVIAPLILILGTALFVSLLDHLDWAVEGIRGLVIVGYCLMAVMPIALVLLPPGKFPRVFPPYSPAVIQELSAWVEPDELLMSDVPWAVAWYGDRNCMWLTQHAVDPLRGDDFYAVNDFRCTVVGLYLTQLTTDEGFASSMLGPGMDRDLAKQRADRDGEVWSETHPAERLSWPEFAFQGLAEGRLPLGFPLRSAQSQYVSYGQLLIMDRERWLEQNDGPKGADQSAPNRQNPPGEAGRQNGGQNL